MYLIIFTLGFLAVVLVIPSAVIQLWAKGELSLWDIGSVVIPSILWYFLGIGSPTPKSIANLVEVFALLTITSCFFVIRLTVARARPFVIFWICTFLAYLLHTLVPTISE